MAPDLQWRQPHAEFCNGEASAAAAAANSFTRKRGGKERQQEGRQCVVAALLLFAASICFLRMALMLSARVAGVHPVWENPVEAEWSNPENDDDAEKVKDAISEEFRGNAEVKDALLDEFRGNATQEDKVNAEDDRGSELPGAIPQAETKSKAPRDDRIAAESYHSPRVFFKDFQEMIGKFKVFVYPCPKNDPFKDIFLPVEFEPDGNYASESYFKKALATSKFVTTDPSEADLFYMPFSISGLRHDRRIGVGGIKDFIKDYVTSISNKWPYWNRTGGSDHFYVACHSVAKSAMDNAREVRLNAIQVVCSSNYHVQGFVPHKDVPIPQIWPRKGNPPQAASTKQRKTLAFFAGGANSPVRHKVVQTWKNDSAIRVYSRRISTPYSEVLLGSKYCLHVKGYEVNTARIGDAMYYGCVPVVIADHYDLPFNSVLNWKSFSVVVTTADIPKLKSILSEISSEEYTRMHNLVMDVRKHFQWHAPPKKFDAFYMAMYQLWLRRHVLRYPLQ